MFVLQVHFGGCGRTAVISSSAASLPISSFIWSIFILQIVSCLHLPLLWQRRVWWSSFGGFSHACCQNPYIFFCPFTLFWDNFIFLPGFQGGLLSFKEIFSAASNLILPSNAHPCCPSSLAPRFSSRGLCRKYFIQTRITRSHFCAPVLLAGKHTGTLRVHLTHLKGAPKGHGKDLVQRVHFLPGEKPPQLWQIVPLGISCSLESSTCMVPAATAQSLGKAAPTL